MSLTEVPPDAPQPGRESPLRKILPFTTIGVILAALYVAWVFYARHESDLADQARVTTEKKEREDRSNRAVFGSGAIQFSTFSADKGVLKAGEHTQLCYGVVNAKSVKLDPPVEAIQPVYRHCLDIAPKATTTYTLTADDGAGHSKSESLTVRVE